MYYFTVVTESFSSFRISLTKIILLADSFSYIYRLYTVLSTMISHSKYKYLNSLKIKKFRNLHGQFVVEGEKIISDLLKENAQKINTIIATTEWLDCNRSLLGQHVDEVIEAGMADLEKISSLETPPPAIAVLNMKEPVWDEEVISSEWSLMLDTIQDPGNLGTIIRTADWFGIRNVICNPQSVDYYNPKVIQASMGAIFRVNIHYTELAPLLENCRQKLQLQVYGTFMKGKSIYEMDAVSKGIMLFGNESKGISPDLLPYIDQQVTIPPGRKNQAHIESLNVASAVAIACSVIATPRRGTPTPTGW
jgi:RNA methyltransferase, TrmH family